MEEKQSEKKSYKDAADNGKGIENFFKKTKNKNAGKNADANDRIMDEKNSQSSTNGNSTKSTEKATKSKMMKEKNLGFSQSKIRVIEIGNGPTSVKMKKAAMEGVRRNTSSDEETIESIMEDDINEGQNDKWIKASGKRVAKYLTDRVGSDSDTSTQLGNHEWNEDGEMEKNKDPSDSKAKGGANNKGWGNGRDSLAEVMSSSEGSDKEILSPSRGTRLDVEEGRGMWNEGNTKDQKRRPVGKNEKRNKRLSRNRKGGVRTHTKGSFDGSIDLEERSKEPEGGKNDNEVSMMDAEDEDGNGGMTAIAKKFWTNTRQMGKRSMDDLNEAETRVAAGLSERARELADTIDESKLGREGIMELDHILKAIGEGTTNDEDLGDDRNYKTDVGEMALNFWEKERRRGTRGIKWLSSDQRDTMKKIRARGQEIQSLGPGIELRTRAELAMIVRALTEEDEGLEEQMEERATLLEEMYMKLAIVKAERWLSERTNYVWGNIRDLRIADSKGYIDYEVEFMDGTKENTEGMRGVLKAVRVGIQMDGRVRERRGEERGEPVIKLRASKGGVPCTSTDGMDDRMNYDQIVALAELNEGVKAMISDSKGVRNGEYTIDHGSIMELWDSIFNWAALKWVCMAREHAGSGRLTKLSEGHEEVQRYVLGLMGDEQAEVRFACHVDSRRMMVPLLAVYEGVGITAGLLLRNGNRGEDYELKMTDRAKEVTLVNIMLGAGPSIVADRDDLEFYKTEAEKILKIEGKKIKKLERTGTIGMHGMMWNYSMVGDKVRKNACIEDDYLDLLRSVEIEFMTSAIHTTDLETRNKTELRLIWDGTDYLLSGDKTLTVRDIEEMVGDGFVNFCIEGGDKDGEHHGMDVGMLDKVIKEAKSWTMARIMNNMQNEAKKEVTSNLGGTVEKDAHETSQGEATQGGKGRDVHRSSRENDPVIVTEDPPLGPDILAGRRDARKAVTERTDGKNGINERQLGLRREKTVEMISNGKNWRISLRTPGGRGSAIIEELIMLTEVDILTDGVGTERVAREREHDMLLAWYGNGYILSGKKNFTIKTLQDVLRKDRSIFKIRGGDKDGELHELDYNILRMAIEEATRLVKTVVEDNGGTGLEKTRREIEDPTSRTDEISHDQGIQECEDNGEDMDLVYMDHEDEDNRRKDEIVRAEDGETTKVMESRRMTKGNKAVVDIRLDKKGERNSVGSVADTERKKEIVRSKYPGMVVANNLNGIKLCEVTKELWDVERVHQYIKDGEEWVARRGGPIGCTNNLRIEGKECHWNVILQGEDVSKIIRSEAYLSEVFLETKIGLELYAHKTNCEEKQHDMTLRYTGFGYANSDGMSIHELASRMANGPVYALLRGGPEDGQTHKLEHNTLEGCIIEARSWTMARSISMNWLEGCERQGRDAGWEKGDERQRSTLEKRKGWVDKDKGEVMGKNDEEEEEEDGGNVEIEEKYMMDTWMRLCKKGDHRWSSMIINNTDMLVTEWPEEMWTIKDCVETTERPKGVNFWYSRWGDDTLVAARCGTRSHVMLEKVRGLLIGEWGGYDYFPDGKFEIIEGTEMEKQWMQEISNMAALRGMDDESINDMFDVELPDVDRVMEKSRKRYTVVIHMDKGIVEYPDEIEWRRREESLNWKEHTTGWGFKRWEDWVVASRDEREEGNWTIADQIMERLDQEKIGPDNDAFGEVLIMDKEEGLRLMQMINTEGKIERMQETMYDTLNFDQTIRMTGMDDTDDGVFIAEVKFQLAEEWAEEAMQRSDQLRECARIELSMYKIQDAREAVKGTNVTIDFSEESGDIWRRTREDRAGEKCIRMLDMEKIMKEKEIVIGTRKDGRVRKIVIKTGGLRDLAHQINMKVEEWGNGIHVWGAKPRDIVDLDVMEKDVEQLQTDKPIIATSALIFGFTKEIFASHSQEEVMEMAIERATQGIKGGCPTRKVELKKRLDGDNGGLLTLRSVGMDGVKGERFGVLVEFVNGMKAGRVEGHGIPIYDWSRPRNSGKKQVNIHLSRQMMTDVETRMILRAIVKRQDYMVVAARGLLRNSTLDDILRRSFQLFLEKEIKIKVHVWVMSIRHNDERGMPRDEAIMIGLLSETGGKKMSERLTLLQCESKRPLMLVEGVDIQLFRDAKAIWNTSKPDMIGRAEKLVEILAPKDCSSKDMISILMEAGISKVCMLSKKTNVGKDNEVWITVPERGETVRCSKVSMGGKSWDLTEYPRHSESGKTETGQISWNMGVKTTSKPREECAPATDERTVSSITTSVSRETTYESKQLEEKVETVVTRIPGVQLAELSEVLKKDREGMREEMETRLKTEREELKNMLREMLSGIAGVGIKKD